MSERHDVHTQPARVYVVDDDSSVGESLEWLLKSRSLEPKICGTLREFERSYAPSEADCLVLDIRLPDGDGLGFLDTLASKYPGLPVIFLTAYGSVSSAVHAMRRGAVDYLEKPYDPETLIDRIHEAHQRSSVHTVARARVARLTAKERQILDRVVEGHSTREIAKQLDRSEKTVEGHRHNIMKKLEATSLAQVVRTATLASYTHAVH